MKYLVIIYFTKFHNSFLTLNFFVFIYFTNFFHLLSFISVPLSLLNFTLCYSYSCVTLLFDVNRLSRIFFFNNYTFSIFCNYFHSYYTFIFTILLLFFLNFTLLLAHEVSYHFRLCPFPFFHSRFLVVSFIYSPFISFFHLSSSPSNSILL